VRKNSRKIAVTCFGTMSYGKSNLWSARAISTQKAGVSLPDRSVYSEKFSRHVGRESGALNKGVAAGGTDLLRQRATESRASCLAPTDITGKGE